MLAHCPVIHRAHTHNTWQEHRVQFCEQLIDDGMRFFIATDHGTAHYCCYSFDRYIYITLGTIRLAHQPEWVERRKKNRSYNQVREKMKANVVS